MLGDLLVVVGQVGTLFLLMGVGFLLTRLGKISADTRGQMSFLLLYVIAPCLVIETLQVDLTPELLVLLGKALLAFLASHLIFILLSRPTFPSRDADTRPVLQFGIIFANTGFMGYPLVEAVAGPDALIFAAVSTVVFNLVQWSYGIVLMGGKASARSMLVNPGTISIAVGAALLFSGLRLPVAVNHAVSFLADMNTPLAMVVIGAQLAAADLPAVFRQPRLYLAAGLRLAAIPLLTALLLLPLRLSGGFYCAMVLLSAVPTAGITSLFAQRFGRDTVLAGQLITLSTLLSIVTLPLFSVLAQGLGGG